MAEEGLEFVRDVLDNFRIHDHSQMTEPYFPFTEESVRAILDMVERNEELKPRSIMHAFGTVLQQAEPLLESREIESITARFAKRALDDYVPAPEFEG